MIIIKPSFLEYVRAKNEALFNEMPLPPTQFKNPKTGELEGDYHVSSRTPVFTDEYDIYYLYQFPPAMWASAMAVRYNDFLYDAKTQGEDYNDIRDVTLTGQGGMKYVFHNRNTFAKHLVDKIERTVDSDHFRKHDNSSTHPEGLQKYKQDSIEHKKAGRDMGGYVGASMADPVKHNVEIGKDKKGEPKMGDMWVGKGFMAPGAGVTSNAITKWMQGSSEGWLRDLDDVEHSTEFIKKRGGRPTKAQKQNNESGGGQSYKVFTGKSLESISHHMAKVGAVPFRVVSNNKVAWPNVSTVGKKTTNYSLYPDAQGASLPLLFPGKRVDSKDVENHNQLKTAMSQLSNLGPDEMAKIKDGVEHKISEIEQEIQRKDANDLWQKKKNYLGVPLDKQELIDNELIPLKNLQDFRNWVRANYANMPLNAATIQNAKEGYEKVLHERMRIATKNAKKYHAYDWNVHDFNRSRHGHDPLGVGMGNPLALGARKYPSLNDSTTGFGNIWPNRQSKHMLHGNPGEWEDKFQQHVGHGHDEITGEFKNKSHLNASDAKEILSQVNKYTQKIGEKLASDSEAAEFLGVSSQDRDQLTNASSLKALIKRAAPEVKFNGKLSKSEEAVPEIVKAAYNELLNVENAAGELQDEAQSGMTKTSPIAAGVKRFVDGPELSQSPDVRAAMQSMQAEIVRNAENFVRRTVGEAAFKNFEDALKGGVSSVEKHQHALDLRDFVESKAFNYAGALAQLDLGMTGTRRERNNRKGKSVSYDATTGDYGGSFGDTLSGQDSARRLAQSQNAGGQFSSNLFGSEEEKNRARLTRGKSDATQSKVGHSVESMYQLLQDAKQRAKAGIAKMQNSTGHIDSSEVDMINKMSAATALFWYFKGQYEDEMEGKGEKVSDAQSTKIGRLKTIEYVKKNKLAPDGFDQPDTHDPEAYAADFKKRMQDEKELDADEMKAAQVIGQWQDEGLDKNKINQKLDMLASTGKNLGPDHKRLVDLILVHYGRKPEMGTFEADPAMAANQGAHALPDIDDRISQEKRRKIAALVMKRQQQKAQQQAQANMGNVQPNPNQPKPFGQ